MRTNTSLLSDLTSRLAPISDTPALDASVLLAHLLNRPRTWVVAHPDLTLTDTQRIQLENALKRLEEGEALPYLLGHWEFFGLDFEINKHVLIPRPETELLVEKAIAKLNEIKGVKTAADVGTGSGVIAISLAVHVPDVRILATDISPKALDVAKHNARKFGVEDRIEFMECDLLPEPAAISSPANWVQSPLNLICANLPYIPTQTLHDLSVSKREPLLALDGGEDGFKEIRGLMALAPSRLAPHGVLLLEIESTLGAQACQLAREYFPNAQIQLHKDLSRRDRLLEIAT
ncbi:MAG TPA: peptide chain release factor N(5)-glutamine methyltransferase [Anaerolineales bacterium]|nr:peptide chain release factor N(5)-glutamine methyltransferase [Anaerolineales bacterium]